MKIDLKELILSNLKELIEKMKQNKGLYLAIGQRLTFEKWLQIELAGQLHSQLESLSDIKVVLEAPIEDKDKGSKRAESIDIAIQRGHEKLFSLELKIIATSYVVSGIDKKTKGITKKINELIYDLKKGEKDSYSECMSLAFIFPFPIQENHRNNAVDFPKHLKKLELHGVVECFEEIHFHRDFKVAFISLYSNKITSGSQP